MSKIIEITGCPTSGKSTLLNSSELADDCNVIFRDSYQLRVQDFFVSMRVIKSPEVKVITLMISALLFKSEVSIMLRIKLALYIFGRFCNHQRLEDLNMNFIVDEGKFHSIFNVIPYLSEKSVRSTLIKILDTVNFKHRIIYIKSSKEGLLDRFHRRDSSDHWYLSHCQGDCLGKYIEKLLVIEDCIRNYDGIDLIESGDFSSTLQEICIQYQES